MQIEGLNRWLTLGANIGVVVGIAFLVVETSQNTTAIRIAARDSATQGHIDYMAHVLDSSILAPAVAKAFANQELSYLETNQLMVFHELRWRHYERVYYQYQNGVFSDQEWAAYKSGILQSFRAENANWRASQETWENINVKLSAEFVTYVDKLVTDQR